MEHYKIDILGTGDPKIDDGELAKLNILGEKIWALQKELAEKTAELKKMKSAYYKAISQRLGCRIKIA